MLLYVACAYIARRHKLPARTTGALAEGDYALRLTRSTYKAIMEIATARRRARHYVAEAVLLAEPARMHPGRPYAERDQRPIRAGTPAVEAFAELIADRL